MLLSRRGFALWTVNVPEILCFADHPYFTDPYSTVVSGHTFSRINLKRASFASSISLQSKEKAFRYDIRTVQPLSERTTAVAKTVMHIQTGFNCTFWSISSARCDSPASVSETKQRNLCTHHTDSVQPWQLEEQKAGLDVLR